MFDSNSITFLQIQKTSGSVFEPIPIPCSHYTPSNVKNYVGTNFYKKLK